MSDADDFCPDCGSRPRWASEVVCRDPDIYGDDPDNCRTTPAISDEELLRASGPLFFNRQQKTEFRERKSELPDEVSRNPVDTDTVTE